MDASSVPVHQTTPGSHEIELKLFVPSSSVARIWTQPLVIERATGTLRVARLDNRYFDTPDGDLAQHGLALRLRRSGRHWVQTLKKASGDEAMLSMRGEWEMPVAGPSLELAALEGTPLSELAPNARARRALLSSLKQVFTTNFRRESRTLRLRDGSEVEFAFDTGAISAGRGAAKRSLPICEVEIEVKHDAGDAQMSVMRFAARLARDLALIPLAASKASRGHRLADRLALPASKAELPVPQAHEMPTMHLSRVLGACHRALLVNVHGLFEVAGAASVVTGVPPDDERTAAVVDAGIDFVHQSRVAIRRMRSALKTFGPVAGGRRMDALDDDLRAMGRVFGELRDWDVFMTTTLDRLEEEVATDAAGREALAAVAADAAIARIDRHRDLMTYLAAGDFGRIAIDVERMVARLARERPGRAVLDRCAASWLSAQRDRVTSRARRIAALDDEQRHGLRIEVKRLRYALDLLEPLYEKDDVEPYHGAVADLQDKLGKLNDAVVADRMIGSLPQSDARDLVRARFEAWLRPHVRKQLPKVASLSVALELTERPWQAKAPTTAGAAS